MKLRNIEYALDQGMELLVTINPISGRFLARVWTGHSQSSHNAAGFSIPEALETLERLLDGTNLKAPEEGA